MSDSIENEVVKLDFNNSAFSRGVNATLGLLSKLKSSLNFSSSAKGLDDIDAAANKVNLSRIANGVDSIKQKFSALSIVAITALANIANRAVDAGIRVVKAFTIDPIKAGFKNYETQINAVQTILANTGLKGAAGLAKVNAVLKELNTYANQTVYNFSDMARNIGTFTAAGVKLGTATQSIKGIANLAALSGSTAEQASGAMYQLSQAIAAGTFKLQDYNSVVTAGIGGKVFQTAIFNSAKALGTIKNIPINETFDQWTKSGHSFRQSLQSGFVTSKVLTNALQGFTGDLTAAQLKSMGYTKQQAAQIVELGKTAVAAATKIKTFTQLQDALKEEVATAYAAIFKTIFGDINHATDLFSKIHTAVENDLTTPIYRFNTILEGAVKLGARSDILKGLLNSVHAISAVLKPIHDAFREIFPPTTSEQIANFAKGFENFTEKLKIGADTANNIKRTFAGFFAVIDIGKQVIGGIFHVIGQLFGALSQGNGGLLNFTGSIGDLLVSLDKALRKSGAITHFFSTLGNILSTPIALLHVLGQLLGSLFSGVNLHVAGGFTKVLDQLGQKFANLDGLSKSVQQAFSNVLSYLQPGINAIAQAFGHLGDTIAQAISNGNFKGVLSTINTVLLGGIVVLIRNFLKKGFGGLNVDFGGGVLGSLKEVFEGLTGNLKALQTQIKAKSLLLIAGAIGILTASVVALSLVNAAKLSSSLKAMAVGFAELLGALKIITQITAGTGFIKLPLVAVSLNLIATSILLLTAAVKNLSGLSYTELAKGLGSVAVLLASISAASIPLSKNSGGMIRAGVGISAIAVALNLLYFAVKGFGNLDLQQLGKGLGSVAILLGTLSAASFALSKNSAGMIRAGIGITAIAAGLNLLYLAVKGFGNLSLEQLGKGLGSVAASLLILAGSLRLMPKGIGTQAAGLLLVAAALNLIGRAVSQIGSLSFETLAKGLGAIGIALAGLALGLNAMDDALPGAAALIVAAGAIKLLVPAITSLGKMSIGDIAKGLGALAVALTLLAVAGSAMDAAALGLTALGIAAAGIGIGIGAAAAGIGLLVSGLAALAGIGTAGTAVLIKALTGFIALIPKAATELAVGLVNIVKVIGQNAPVFIEAFEKIIAGIAKAVIDDAPKIGQAIEVLLNTVIALIVKEAPKLIAAGLNILLDLLHGIANNIGKIVPVVAQILVKFLSSVASHIGEVVKAGLNLVVQLVKGISSGIGQVVKAVGSLITHFLGAVSNQLGKIVTAGANMVIHLINGIGNNIDRVANAATKVVIRFINAVASDGDRIANAGAKALVRFVNGLADAVNRYAPQLRSAGIRLAAALIDGMTGGLASRAGSIFSEAQSIASHVISTLESALHIHSPSRLTMEIGANVGAGLALGIANSARQVGNSSAGLANSAILAMKKTISGLNDAVDTDVSLNPVVTPVIDLTQFRKDAGQLVTLLPQSPKITPEVSSAKANDLVAAAQAAAEAANDISEPTPSVTNINYNQTNNSPESLSTIDIYRNTKNQLSQAKALFKVP